MMTHDNDRAPVEDRATVELALSRGSAAARAGFLSVATKHFEQAAELAPDNPHVWRWLAWVANSPENSIRCLERLLELDPDNQAAAAGLSWTRSLLSDLSDTNVVSSAISCHADSLTTPVEAAAVSSDLPSATEASESDWPDSPIEALPVSVAYETSVELAPEPPETIVTQQIAPVVEEVSSAVVESSTVEPQTEAQPEFSSQDSPRRRWDDLVKRAAQMPLPELAEPASNDDVASPPTVVAAEQPLAGNETTESTPAETLGATAGSDHATDTHADLETLSETFVPATDAPASDGRPLIMVVDDSPTVRKLVSLTLERRGYRVISAFDGVAAIKELGSCRPDLILLDINMPRLDGYRLCKLIKKHEATQSIPVVMLSGKDGMFDKLRGRLVGCSDYITKPFEADALTHKVAKYLNVTPASTL